jgi:hypothetical protein
MLARAYLYIYITQNVISRAGIFKAYMGEFNSMLALAYRLAALCHSGGICGKFKITVRIATTLAKLLHRGNNIEQAPV